MPSTRRCFHPPSAADYALPRAWRKQESVRSDGANVRPACGGKSGVRTYCNAFNLARWTSAISSHSKTCYSAPAATKTLSAWSPKNAAEELAAPVFLTRAETGRLMAAITNPRDHAIAAMRPQPSGSDGGSEGRTGGVNATSQAVTGALEQLHLPQPQRPSPDREWPPLNLFAQPQLAPTLGPSAARHSQPLRRIVLGVATGAEHGHPTPVSGIVREVRDV